jgi:putative salt-induced outer membrane protein YdiY
MKIYQLFLVPLSCLCISQISVAANTTSSDTSPSINFDSQTVDYQKEADKYKEMYEKFQKLADEKAGVSNKSKETKPTDNKVIDKNNEKPVVAPPPKEVKKEKSPWQGTSASLGGSFITGNSAAKNLNMKGSVNYNTDLWENDWWAQYIFQSDDTQNAKKPVKVKRAQINTMTSYNIVKRGGVYGSAIYLLDELDDFDYVLTLSSGAKINLFKTDTMRLGWTLGPSITRVKNTNTQATTNEFGGQTQLKYLWDITDKSTFKQDFLYNYAAQKKGFLQSNTTITAKIYKNIALSLSFQLDHRDTVSTGKNPLNTITTTNIVYTL